VNLLISIIVPVFNASKYIEATLISALNQTYSNLEIIIVDDHSTDNSWEIINKIAVSDQRISIYKNPKKGASSARNYAFFLSNGQYVQYLDADDILHKDKIKVQLSILAQQSEENILIGCRWQRFSDDISNRIGKIGPILENSSFSYTNTEWLLQRPDMAPVAWLIKREFIMEVSGWDESLTRNDDGEFMYRILATHKKVIIIPKILVFYRTEAVASLSKGLSKESVESWIKSALTYKRVLQSVAPIEGEMAADKFLYFLYYICTFRYSDLAKKCYAELYFPENIYEIGDNFVFKLAKLTNIKFAKAVRISINWLRGLENV
jgi:glycosyltransferase involved in cell wall biosynthesis